MNPTTTTLEANGEPYLGLERKLRHIDELKREGLLGAATIVLYQLADDARALAENLGRCALSLYQEEQHAGAHMSPGNGGKAVLALACAHRGEYRVEPITGGVAHRCLECGATIRMIKNGLSWEQRDELTATETQQPSALIEVGEVS